MSAPPKVFLATLGESLLLTLCPFGGEEFPPFNLGATNACAVAGMFAVVIDPSPVSIERTPAPPPYPYPLGPNNFP